MFTGKLATVITGNVQHPPLKDMTEDEKKHLGISEGK